MSRRLLLTTCCLAAIGAGSALVSPSRADILETGTNAPVPVVTGAGTVTVGGSAAGTLTINDANGAQTFSAGTLIVGQGTTGNGTLEVTGATTSVSLGVVGQNVLVIGNGGVGTATISAGATLTDTRLAADFGGNGSAVGGSAGAVGSLTITGAGSTATLGRSVIVGNSAVPGTPGNANGFGTPGGTTVGTLNVASGGTLNTNQLTVGSQQLPAANNAANGLEHAFGTVTISGAGSTATITGIPGLAGISLGIGPNGTGSLTVSAGGTLNLTTSNPASPGSLGFGVNLGGVGGGTAGGSGSLTVDAGAVHFIGPFTNTASNQAINVGGNQGSGTLTVQNGGILDGVNAILVGRDGSSGTMTVTGAGSKVTTIATGTLGGGVNVGFIAAAGLQATLGATTTGILNVTNGGEIDITLDASGSFLQAGRRGATGTINISGTGSKIVMAGNNGNSASPSSVNIGRNSTGTLNVTAGGLLVVNDTGPGGASGLFMGGSAGQVAGGETSGIGTVLVSGAGSKIDIQSAHAAVGVGYSNTGSLTVNAGGVVNAEHMDVGRSTGVTGTLVVDGAGSQVNLAGNDGAVITGGNQTLNGGARMNVGLAGTGTATISNGAAVTINPTNPVGAQAGGLFIGGGVAQNATVLPGNTTIGAGGTGTVNVTNGSSLIVGGSATNSVIVVGGNGTGTLNITGASTVSLPSTGAMYVGAPIPGVTPTVPLSGAVTVAGGSSLNAGSLLAIGSNGVGNNNTGTGSVLMTGNSTITATNIVIGQNGLFGGNGTVNGTVTNNGGILQVGASPDLLVINGAYTQHGGTINLEIFSDGAGGFLTNGLVFTNPTQVLLDHVTFDFAFMSPDIAPDDFFQGSDPLATLGTFLLSGDGTNNTPLLPALLDTIVVAANVDISTVPEPATLALLGSGIAGLACLRRRRRPTPASVG